jgi:hypothetical protein
VEILFGPEAASAKFQPQPVMLPEDIVEESWKQVWLPMQTVGAEKFATGKGFINAFALIESMQPKLLVTINDTLYVPEAL